MELTTASKSELIRIIYEQRDQIAALTTQITELRSRLKDQGPKEKEPLPSWVKPNVKKQRKHQRKHRRQGFGRKLDTPTKQVFHSYDQCPDCGEALGKPSVSYTRQTIDIAPTPVDVTQHVVFKRWCFHCKKRVAPKINLAGIAVGRQRIGIRLMSMIAMFKEAFRQPLETIQSYFSILHNLHLSEGEIVLLLQKTANQGKPTYEGLITELQKSHAVHADETGGRENGKNGYTWNFNMFASADRSNISRVQNPNVLYIVSK